MKKVGKEIQKLLKEGKNNSEIQEIYDVAKSTISYHRKILGIRKYIISKKIYNWKEIDEYIIAGYSLKETSLKFNISMSLIRNAKINGNLKYLNINEFSLENYLKTLNKKASSSNRKIILKKFLKEGKEYKCFECNISQWNNKPIKLQIDHINGDGRNNSLENLRILCPNCHSQTPTFAGRNKKKYT